MMQMPNQCMSVLSSVSMAHQQLTIRCSCVDCATFSAAEQGFHATPYQLQLHSCAWVWPTTAQWAVTKCIRKMTGTMQLKMLFCFCRMAASTQHAQRRTYQWYTGWILVRSRCVQSVLGLARIDRLFQVTDSWILVLWSCLSQFWPVVLPPWNWRWLSQKK